MNTSVEHQWLSDVLFSEVIKHQGHMSWEVWGTPSGIWAKLISQDDFWKKQGKTRQFSQVIKAFHRQKMARPTRKKYAQYMPSVQLEHMHSSVPFMKD